MGATFFISDNDVWTTSSAAFAVIVDRTRNALNGSDTVLDVFTPIDEGFNHVVLDDVDMPTFQSFYHACRDEFSKFQTLINGGEAPDDYWAVIAAEWRTLLKQLEADPRLKGHNSRADP